MFGSKVEYAEGKERIIPVVKRLTNCWAASLDYIVMTIR